MSCDSVIPSPWVFGMRIRCEKPAGHEGLHSFHTVKFDGDDTEVHWSGQHDKLTEIERRSGR